MYFKIQPYKQITLSAQRFHKLAARYYIPFQVLKRVVPVAYTLLFPDSVKIHPNVHVSLLKKYHEVLDRISYHPVLDIANLIVLCLRVFYKEKW